MDSDIRLEPDRISIQAWDLDLSHPGRRLNGNTNKFRRALVHDEGDRLTINYAGDYPGGVKIAGTAGLEVSGSVKSTDGLYSGYLECDGTAWVMGHLMVARPENSSPAIDVTKPLEYSSPLTADVQYLSVFDELARLRWELAKTQKALRAVVGEVGSLVGQIVIAHNKQTPMKVTGSLIRLANVILEYGATEDED